MAQRSNRRFLNLISVEALEAATLIRKRAGGIHHGQESLTPPKAEYRLKSNYRVATTNDQGEYRLTNLETGQYFFRTMRVTGYGGQYYGGANDAKDAIPIICAERKIWPESHGFDRDGFRGCRVVAAGSQRRYM